MLLHLKLISFIKPLKEGEKFAFMLVEITINDLYIHRQPIGGFESAASESMCRHFVFLNVNRQENSILHKQCRKTGDRMAEKHYIFSIYSNRM